MVCFACCALLLAGRAQAEPMEYVYGYFSKTGDRDNYVYALLDEALTRTSAKWGPYALRTVPEVPRNRQIRELETGAGSITFAVLGTAHDIGKHLRPILIPVDKGLVGYRLLLVRRADQKRFSRVREPADLKAFSFGQNFTWDDVDILRANGVRVQAGDDFDGLFQMLNRSRFDAFPRGIGEIGREFGEYGPLYPDMEIEQDLLIHYPLPIYFWFARNPGGEKMAERLEDGLRSMIADGSYDSIFWRYNRILLHGLGLGRRRVLTLDNPFLPPDTPLNDARLWLTPEQLQLGVGAGQR